MAKRAQAEILEAVEVEPRIVTCTMSIDLNDHQSGISIKFEGGENWSRSLLERMKKKADRELRRYKIELQRERTGENG